MHACISLPGFSLQVLFRRETLDPNLPAAVLTSDKPSARVVAVNRAAYRRGILPGMRYSQVLSLFPEVRASPVSDAEQKKALRDVAGIILRYTPDAEPVPLETAHYFVPLSGLLRLFPSARQWGEAVQSALAEEGFRAHVAFGAGRLEAYLAAKVRSGKEESGGKEWIDQQSLSLLPIPPKDLETLHLLGIRRIGDFSRISPSRLKSRFSRETVFLHGFVGSREPVVRLHEREDGSIRRERRYEPPLVQRDSLLSAIRILLEAAVEDARRQGVWIHGIEITLTDEENREYAETIRSAGAQQNGVFFLRLIALRFEGLQFSPIVQCRLTLQASAPVARQETLIDESGICRDEKFDAPAFERLIVLLQAEYSDSAVTVGEVHSAALPEERYSWERVQARELSRSWQQCLLRRAGEALPPAPGTGSVTRVRRIFEEPEATTVLRRDLRRGKKISGPVLVSTNWWRGLEVGRAYYLIRLSSGRIAWAYRQQSRSSAGRWFVQGYLA